MSNVNMTKAEIIKEISRKTGVERVHSEQIVETFMSIVKEKILNKEPVTLRGFGNFIPKKRAAKVARNINKGTAIHLPEHYVPAFKPSVKFKRKVK